MFIKILGGFLMALADSVPGVSGGTIAFIIGIYDEFICSLNDIASKDALKRKKAISFLIKMGCGWIAGMALAAVVISSIFESHIYVMSSLFIGFIIGSLPLIIIEEKTCLKGKWLQALWAIAGAGLVCVITYLSTHSLSGIEGLKWGQFSFANGVYVFLVAALAISAMVLPGISGSTVMLIFGIYLSVIGAIKGFLHFEFEYIPGLIVFGLGILTGICTVVKVLRFALLNHRASIVYFILGMMAASVYAIVMGPASPSLENPKAPLSMDTFSILWFVIGLGFIALLQFVKVWQQSVEKKNN